MAYSPDGSYLASSGSDGTLRVWEIFTCQECCRFTGHQGAGGPVAFSPNGKALASGCDDCTVLIWNVWYAALNDEKTPRQVDVPASWRSLASAEPSVAHQAMGQLISRGDETVSFLKKTLAPASKPTAADIKGWISGLEEGSYAEREKATKELKKLGAVAHAALREALAGKPSLEMRRRAENILANPPALDKDPDRVRARRAVVVLEHIGTPDALHLLRRLSAGTPAAWLTHDAKAAADRLTKHL